MARMSNGEKMASLVIEEIEFRMNQLSKWEAEYKEQENRNATINCFSRYDELLRLKQIVKTMIEAEREGYL